MPLGARRGAGGDGPGWVGVTALVLVGAPAVVGIAWSAAAAVGWVGVGIGATTEGAARVVRVLSEPGVWRGTLWSLRVAALSTGLALIAALATAGLFRGSDRSSRLVRASAALPLPLPHIVAALAALLLLSQSGVLARLAAAAGWIEVPADMPAWVFDRAGVGVIAALAWKEYAFLVVVAWSVLAGRGAELEEAARTLGAGPVAAFLRVTLPLLLRALLPATVSVFVFVAGSYEVAALLAPSDPLPLPVLTMERYLGADLAARADAWVLALLAFAVALAAVIAHEWARRRWGTLS
jgi:putative spermidine/putrescine transport system permease protein